MDKPVPEIDADSREFRDGCNRGELRYQYCTSCGAAQFYPGSVCRRCQAKDHLEWRTSAGKGTLYTFSMVHRGPSLAFKPDQPYALTLVDLDEGFRMMLNAVDCDPTGLHIGQRGHIVYERRGDQHIPQFRPEENS